MPQNFQKSFNLYLHDKYPATKERGLFIRDNLISPVTLKISRETLAQAQSVATACFELRNLLKYQEHVAAQSGELARFDPKNFSLFMSYDFHQTENGLKLIEINTNAAFSLVAWELYNYRNVDPGESFHEQFK
ncbi:MAG TPA: hypothetical protein VFV50_03340, partial [Bdellovibrionales bacterium]|nr:hypothetical protein [Bdellovibrionales bacterium]